MSEEPTPEQGSFEAAVARRAAKLKTQRVEPIEVWKAIESLVDQAVLDKMHALCVPADPKQKNCFNHFHGNALVVLQSYCTAFAETYLNWHQKGQKPSGEYRKRLNTSASKITRAFYDFREAVAGYGNLATAHTPDGTLASRLLSNFAEASSPPKHERDIVHLELMLEQGPSEADLTMLKLEEEFKDTIKLAGMNILMAFLKKNFGLDVEINDTLVAEMPEFKLPSKATGRTGKN